MEYIRIQDYPLTDHQLNSQEFWQSVDCTIQPYVSIATDVPGQIHLGPEETLVFLTNDDWVGRVLKDGSGFPMEPIKRRYSFNRTIRSVYFWDLKIAPKSPPQTIRLQGRLLEVEPVSDVGFYQLKERPDLGVYSWLDLKKINETS